MFYIKMLYKAPFLQTFSCSVKSAYRYSELIRTKPVLLVKILTRIKNYLVNVSKNRPLYSPKRGSKQHSKMFYK